MDFHSFSMPFADTLNIHSELFRVLQFFCCSAPLFSPTGAKYSYSLPLLPWFLPRSPHVFTRISLNPMAHTRRPLPQPSTSRCQQFIWSKLKKTISYDKLFILGCSDMTLHSCVSDADGPISLQQAPVWLFCRPFFCVGLSHFYIRCFIRFHSVTSEEVFLHFFFALAGGFSGFFSPHIDFSVLTLGSS